MSLINDALKKANQAQKKKPHSAPAVPGMQPVAPGNFQQKSWTPMIVGAVLAVCGLAFFFWKGGDKEEAQAPLPDAPIILANVPTEPPVQVAPIRPIEDLAPTARPANEQPRGEPPPAVKAALESPVVKTPPAQEQPPSAPVIAQTPAAAPTAPAESTELKLQGIFYRLRNPTAMINGESVGVGDTVAGARIVAIQRTSVIVSRGGNSETLTLK